jgi:O-antigen ligase
MNGSHGVREALAVVAIAAAYVAIALVDGGYGEQTRAAMTFLVWWVFIVVAIGRLRGSTALSPAGLIAAAALAGLAAFTLLSASWATDDGAVFNEAVRAAGYLGLFMLVIVVAHPGARLWVAGLAVGLTAVAILALGSRLIPSLFPDQSALGLLASTSPRLSYPVNYWNGLGACMALAILLLAHFGAESAARIGRALAVGAIPIAGLALFLTASRGGVGAMAIGLVTLVAVARNRGPLLAGVLMGALATGCLILLADAREAFVDGDLASPDSSGQRTDMVVFTALAIALTGAARYAADAVCMALRPSRAVGYVVCAGLAVLAIGVTAAGVPQDVWEEFKEPPPAQAEQSDEGYVVSHLASAGGSGRYQLWENAWSAFETEPVRGIGAGAFEAWWTRTGSRYQPVRDAHSIYVETLAQLGMVGGALLLLFLLAPLVAAARVNRRLSSSGRVAVALVAAGAASAAVDWTWELPAAFVPVVVALGVVSVEASTQRRARVGRPVRVAGAVALGVVAMALALVSYVAADALSDSRRAYRDGDVEGAIDEAEESIAATPWAAAPRLQLALIEETRDLPAALAYVNQALDRASDDWRIWVVAARLRVRAGDIDGARRALQMARRLNPRAEFLPG